MQRGKNEVTIVESYIKIGECVGATALSWLFYVWAELYELNFLLLEYSVEYLYRLRAYYTDTGSSYQLLYRVVQNKRTPGYSLCLSELRVCSCTVAWQAHYVNGYLRSFTVSTINYFGHQIRPHTEVKTNN